MRLLLPRIKRHAIDEFPNYDWCEGTGSRRLQAKARINAETSAAQSLHITPSKHAHLPDGFHVVLLYDPIMENSPKTSVLFNATCPVCNFEIQHYARYAVANDLPIQFDDLNSDARERWGIDADTAARRLYVLQNGTLTSGIPAFLVLWAQMPRYRWLVRVIGMPGIRQIACVTYDFVLAPAIYRWHLLRLRRQTPLESRTDT